MTVNPRDFLNGQTPLQRAQQNKLMAVDWIYRWGSTSSQVLRLCLSKESASWSSIAVKRGLLRSTRTESGVPAVFYTLSEMGLELAHHHATSLIAYPELDPYRVNQSKLRHDLMVQRLSITAQREGLVTKVQSEREVNDGDQRGEKRPDAIWHLRDGRRIGIELELSAKWGRKLDDFIAAIATAIDPAQAPNGLDAFSIVTDSEPIVDRYREAMKPGQPMRRWAKNARNHWVIEEETVVPDWMHGRIDFRVITG